VSEPAHVSDCKGAFEEISRAINSMPPDPAGVLLSRWTDDLKEQSEKLKGSKTAINRAGIYLE
jgi:hypothetical protein